MIYTTRNIAMIDSEKLYTIVDSCDNLEDFQTEIMPYLEAEGDDPAGRLIMAEETGDLYRAALSCLSEYELHIFLLYIRGEAPRRIASEVGRTEKSVSNAIGRMLRKLRGQLK